MTRSGAIEPKSQRPEKPHPPNHLVNNSTRRFRLDASREQFDVLREGFAWRNSPSASGIVASPDERLAETGIGTVRQDAGATSRFGSRNTGTNFPAWPQGGTTPSNLPSFLLFPLSQRPGLGEDTPAPISIS